MSTMRFGARQASLVSYITGYVLSVALTVAAYVVVRGRHNTRDMLIALVSGLALVQFLVQLLFFLHLGAEAKPRWRLLMFSFMVMVVGIIVGGSVWIMANLNSHMTHDEMNQYMSNQDSL